MVRLMWLRPVDVLKGFGMDEAKEIFINLDIETVVRRESDIVVRAKVWA